MRTHKIALYPGDGIGPEVVDATMVALDAVQRIDGGFRLECESFGWGVQHYERHGCIVPEDFLDTLGRFDAIFLGALGWPAKVPDGIALRPLMQLRQSFELFVNVRPARTFQGIPGPLRSDDLIDMVVVRENSEGEYVSSGGLMSTGTPNELAIQSAIHTRRGIERILRFGFQMAQTRRKRLAMITKSNAMPFGYGLWDRVLVDVAPEYPDVSIEKLHIDAAVMHLVQRPQTFDIIVASNLFGDILSDLSGGITGSLGLNPSGNLDPERRKPSLFEPVHGSAPDIAGKGIANPAAAILSAAMMLEWLGERRAAEMIRNAVPKAFLDGQRTPDIGGKLTTMQMANAIADRLGE